MNLCDAQLMPGLMTPNMKLCVQAPAHFIASPFNLASCLPQQISGLLYIVHRVSQIP